MNSLAGPVPVYRIKGEGGNLFAFRHGAELAVFCTLDDEMELEHIPHDQWLMLDFPEATERIIGAMVERASELPQAITQVGVLSPLDAAGIYEHCNQGTKTLPERHEEIKQRAEAIADQYMERIGGRVKTVLDITASGAVIDGEAPPLYDIPLSAHKVPLWSQLFFRIGQPNIKGSIYAVDLPKDEATGTSATAYFDVVPREVEQGQRIATRSEPIAIESHTDVDVLSSPSAMSDARWGAEREQPDGEFHKAWDAIDRELNKPRAAQVWNDVKAPLKLAAAVTGVTLLYRGIKQKVDEKVEEKIAARAKDGKLSPSYIESARRWGMKMTFWATGLITLLGTALVTCGSLVMQGAQQRVLDGERTPNEAGGIGVKEVAQDLVTDPAQVQKDLAAGIERNKGRAKWAVRMAVEGAQAVDDFRQRNL